MSPQVPNRRRIFVIVALVVSLVSTGVVLLAANKKADWLPPRTGPVIESVYGLGTVIAPQTYQVKTGVNQAIQEIYVKEGDRVKAGAALLRLDESGVSRAPFAGTVTSIPFKRGEIVFAGTSGLVLVNLENLFLEISLEQQSVLRVMRGQKAIVSFEAIRGDQIEAVVESVFPRDAQFIIRIMPEKFPDGILPGMTADVAIEVGRKENVLSIPLRSLSSGKVTFRRAGKKIKETVRIGVVDGQWAEVLSGNIRAEDEILVRSD